MSGSVEDRETRIMRQLQTFADDGHWAVLRRLFAFLTGLGPDLEENIRQDLQSLADDAEAADCPRVETPEWQALRRLWDFFVGLETGHASDLDPEDFTEHPFAGPG